MKSNEPSSSRKEAAEAIGEVFYWLGESAGKTEDCDRLITADEFRRIGQTIEAGSER